MIDIEDGEIVDLSHQSQDNKLRHKNSHLSDKNKSEKLIDISKSKERDSVNKKSHSSKQNNSHNSKKHLDKSKHNEKYRNYNNISPIRSDRRSSHSNEDYLDKKRKHHVTKRTSHKAENEDKYLSKDQRLIKINEVLRKNRHSNHKFTESSVAQEFESKLWSRKSKTKEPSDIRRREPKKTKRIDISNSSEDEKDKTVVWHDLVDDEEQQLLEIKKRREKRNKALNNMENSTTNIEDSNNKLNISTKSISNESKVHKKESNNISEKPTDYIEISNDMFGDDFKIQSKEFYETTFTAKNSEYTHLTDNFDDAEGYYKFTIGEIMGDKYIVQSFIGQGVFSNVVEAQSICDSDKGLKVAIKIIRNNELMHNQGLKELNVLRILNDADELKKHNIMELIGSFQYRNHLCIVFPRMNMNLREVLKQYGKDVGLSIIAISSYAKQLYRALKLLKSCDFIHADIKPDNILVCDNNVRIKLADFGSVLKSHENDFTPYMVSRFYRAPEIIIGHPYGFGIDMWSVGVTLYELYTGHVMFPGSSNNQMLRKISEMFGKIPNRIIQRSLFKAKHFDEQGTFLYRDIDPITQNERITPIYFVENSGSRRDLLSELRKYTIYNSGLSKINHKENLSKNNEDGQKINASSIIGSRAYIDKKVNQFKELLSKNLAINPQKRISPKEALLDDFIVD